AVALAAHSVPVSPQRASAVEAAPEIPPNSPASVDEDTESTAVDSHLSLVIGTGAALQRRASALSLQSSAASTDDFAGTISPQLAAPYVDPYSPLQLSPTDTQQTANLVADKRLVELASETLQAMLLDTALDRERLQFLHACLRQGGITAATVWYSLPWLHYELLQFDSARQRLTALLLAHAHTCPPDALRYFSAAGRIDEHRAMRAMSERERAEYLRLMADVDCGREVGPMLPAQAWRLCVKPVVVCDPDLFYSDFKLMVVGVAKWELSPGNDTIKQAVKRVEIAEAALAVANHAKDNAKRASFYDEAGIPPGSRTIQDKHHNLAKFIKVELVSRAAAILRQVEPRAKVVVIKGHPTDHADMFLRVDVSRNGKDTLSSSVVVETTVPPGANEERPMPEHDADATGSSRVATMASMIDTQFLRETVDKAHAYSRDAKRRVPRDNALLINRRFTFVTTFNDWWILRYLDHESVGGSDSRRAPGCARMVRVSHRFTATATDPHVAFAIAFVLYLVAKDLLGEPTGFEWDDDEDAKWREVSVLPSELANDMIKWAAKYVENTNAALAKANQANNKATQAKDKTKYAVGELLHSQRSTALGASPMPLTPPYSKSQAKSRKLSEKQPLLPAKANATRTAAIEHRRSNPSVASPPSHAITPRADTETKKHGTAGAETADQLEGWKRLNGSLTIGQMLGEGRSGTVNRGKYNGRPAALKISFADAAPEIVEEMRNEVAVYEQLADLQGTDIPQLYDWGLADIGGFQ
ncbi:hypothetical protein LPJ70_001910, partial [Coemansia sp. RSA 2708]